jgi:hypothetical protein
MGCRTIRLAAICVAVLGAAGLASTRQSAAPTEAASRHHAIGVEYHLGRRLDEASAAYAKALALDPPRDPTVNERAIVSRFAPRVYVTPTEFFPLKDFAAILHPTARLVAYHFFWEDDIDFPDDNDPCDHEVAWVQYSRDGTSLERLWTYFHGRILEGGEAALRDAREHAMRARVNVQWGKHGSMPADWENIPIVANTGDIERRYLTLDTQITLAEYNRAAFRKLSSEGRRQRDHAIAKRLGWPDRFEGAWEGFVDFSRPVDVLSLLDERRMIVISRWNSAVINQRLLTYNFRPKTEWPPAADERKPPPARRSSAGTSGGSLLPRFP